MKKTQMLAGTISFLLFWQVSFGHEMGVKDVSSRIQQGVAALKKSPISQFQSTHKTQLDKNAIEEALKYLETIPQVKPILRNLPENITYVFSSQTLGIANFDGFDNTITINPNVPELNHAQWRLSLYKALAHELCHANQKKEGIYYNDLKNASFGDTFRVAKLMEAETRLLTAIVENELFKRAEFKGYTPSLDGYYYQQELKRTNNNVAQANTNFVLSYWQNAKNNSWIDKSIRENILERYFFYTEQAYHNALLMHDPEFGATSTNRTTPLQAAQTYGKRMSLKGINMESFLQNGFDGAMVTENFKEGVTVLYHNGTKYLQLTPTAFDLWDKVIFFENDQVDKTFLRNTTINKMIEYTGSEDSEEEMARTIRKSIIRKSIRQKNTTGTSQSSTPVLAK